MENNDIANQPAPDWGSRPWGRPTVFAAQSDLNAKLVGMAEFRYHGIRIRGVRIFRNDDGTLYVNMPQKRFGESIESVVYFHDPIEREQFNHDVAWLWLAIFSTRYPEGARCRAID